MRIWLIGAGDRAVQTIRQLKKNQQIDLVVSDPSDRPKAVSEGILDRVDYIERITHLNINQVARRVRPDLILVDASTLDRDWGHVSGGSVLSEAMTNEIASASDYPCIILD